MKKQYEGRRIQYQPPFPSKKKGKKGKTNKYKFGKNKALFFLPSDSHFQEHKGSKHPSAYFPFALFLSTKRKSEWENWCLKYIKVRYMEFQRNIHFPRMFVRNIKYSSRTQWKTLSFMRYCGKQMLQLLKKNQFYSQLSNFCQIIVCDCVKK